MITITYASGATSNFAYDPLGRRVSIVEKDNSGTITSTKNLLWAGQQIIQERDASNNITKKYYAQGVQIWGSNYYYSKDHLGSIREVTDSSGAIQARYDYDAYGNATKLSGSIDSDFQYAGYYCHAPSKLSLTLYRAYDPNTARWLNRDPIEEQAGINLYGYVLENPVGNIDPFGLDALILVGGNKKDPSFFTRIAQIDAELYEEFYPSQKASIVNIRSIADMNAALKKTMKIDYLEYLGHGGVGNLYFSATGEMRTADVASLDKGNILPGAAINLSSCNSAAGGKDSMAQAFANHFGVNVSGYDSGLSFGFTAYFISPNNPLFTIMPSYRRGTNVKITPEKN